MNRPSIPRVRWRTGAMLAPAALILLAAGPARAQFSWFGPREASPQDVSDTIADHGFTLVGPLYRNGRVYLADVIDRRRRRERLVIAADSGEIVQRYFVDVGPERRAPVAAPRQAPRDDSFFSHLTRGWDDEPPPRPPVGLPGQDVVVVPAPAAPLARPKPRVVTRTESPAVTASPLPPPASSAAAKPEVVAVPSAAASSETGASSVRGTSVSTDPLRIPGTRKAEETRSAKPASAANVAVSKPPEPAAPAPAPVKPKPAPATDVPVAPLD